MTISPVRTLFITRKLTYPPIGGAPLRNWQNINIMMKYGPVAVFSILLAPSSSSTESPPGVAVSSIHYIDDGQYSLWGKINRQMQLWRSRINGYLEADNYYACKVEQEMNRFLTEFKPDLVIFEELCLYYYLPVVKRHKCCIIYDAHNVESFLYREVKQKAIKSLKSKIKANIEIARMNSIERDFVEQTNQVWVCSDHDANLLQTLCKKELSVRVVPNGVDVAYYNSINLSHYSLPSNLEPVPFTLIFTASFSYQPNVLAARLLLQQIYPRLQKIHPNCRLLLVGINPTQDMHEAAKKDAGIVVTGKVPDIRPYLSASSIVIVPLFHGGGTRLKILEAFAAGRPVVSTSKGAEGLKVRDGEHLLLGNCPDDLVAGVCRLWSETSLGQKLTRSAYDLVQNEYSWAMVGQKVEAAIRELL